MATHHCARMLILRQSRRSISGLTSSATNDAIVKNRSFAKTSHLPNGSIS